MARTQLVGIDCAVDPRKTGVAIATVAAAEVTVERVWIPVSSDELVAGVAEALSTSRDVLLALDAPLGWPDGMRAALSAHEAGAGLPVGANAMFRRETDDFVHQTLRKRPLDVGADRIARTAHAALNLLRDLRARSALSLPLYWQPGERPAEPSVIEVYPAASLAARGWPSSKYKGKTDEALRVREQILDRVVGTVALAPGVREEAIRSDHALDAVICILAALDVLRGHALPPADLDRAKREGWIWVRRPDK